MAVTSRFPHQIVVMTGEKANDFIRARAEEKGVSIAEVAREAMDRGIEAIEAAEGKRSPPRRAVASTV